MSDSEKTIPVRTEATQKSWNSLLSENLKQRSEKVQQAISKFMEVGEYQTADFLNWFATKSAVMRPSLVVVRALRGGPADSQNAWRLTVDEESGEPVGIGRLPKPPYFHILHIGVGDGQGGSLYDTPAILSEHEAVIVRDAEGHKEQWPTSGISIAAYNQTEGILVTLKPTVAANPLADTLAFSMANLQNIQEASQGPDGLKSLAAKTLKTVQMLTGKENPTRDDLLATLQIVGNTPSGDENKQTMYVLQALVEISDDKTAEVAEALDGYWVKPEVLQKIGYLGVTTDHLRQASGTVEIVRSNNNWADTMAVYMLQNTAEQAS